MPSVASSSSSAAADAAATASCSLLTNFVCVTGSHSSLRGPRFAEIANTPGWPPTSGGGGGSDGKCHRARTTTAHAVPFQIWEQW
jgi:hypothetical protein